MSVTSEARSRGPRIPTIRNSAYPLRDRPRLYWLTSSDPMTKLAIVLAAFASIFCVGSAVAIAFGRAML